MGWFGKKKEKKKGKEEAENAEMNVGTTLAERARELI